MASDQAKRRRGGIRERGGVYQVRVYVGTDPVTGERVDLTGTAATEREAEKLLTRFLAEKDARRARAQPDHARRGMRPVVGQPRRRGQDQAPSTRATLRRTLRPVFGAVPVARLDAPGHREPVPPSFAAADG